MSTTRRDAIDAFLASPAAQALRHVTPEQSREVLERFLGCFEEHVEAPIHTLDGPLLHALVGHALPERYAIGDPLAEVTGPVLAAWLEHERPNFPAQRLAQLLQSLHATIPEFVHAAKTGHPVHHDHGGHEHERGETFVREMPKVGRNDPCPCGSGKKFKACCARG